MVVAESPYVKRLASRARESEARAREIGRYRDERSDALAQEFDQKRREFYAAAAPVLVSIMEARRAAVILDETTVLLADQALLVTPAAGEGGVHLVRFRQPGQAVRDGASPTDLLPIVGAHWGNTAAAGVFSVVLDSPSSAAYYYFGARAVRLLAA